MFRHIEKLIAFSSFDTIPFHFNVWVDFMKSTVETAKINPRAKIDGFSASMKFRGLDISRANGHVSMTGSNCFTDVRRWNLCNHCGGYHMVTIYETWSFGWKIVIQF
jgi:hypothetical protein